MNRRFKEFGILVLMFMFGYTVNSIQPKTTSEVIINETETVIDKQLIKNEKITSISEYGLNFIKQYEKFSATPYKDNYGSSIGYGHLIKEGEQFTSITKKEADKLFENDVEWVNSAVQRTFKPLRFEPSQGMYDAVASIIYNCGEEGMKRSEFYKRLNRIRVKNGVPNQNDVNYTAAAIKECRIPSKASGCKEGVQKRRYNEHILFLS